MTSTVVCVSTLALFMFSVINYATVTQILFAQQTSLMQVHNLCTFSICVYQFSVALECVIVFFFAISQCRHAHIVVFFVCLSCNWFLCFFIFFVFFFFVFRILGIIVAKYLLLFCWFYVSLY